MAGEPTRLATGAGAKRGSHAGRCLTGRRRLAGDGAPQGGGRGVTGYVGRDVGSGSVATSTSATKFGPFGCTSRILRLYTVTGARGEDIRVIAALDEDGKLIVVGLEVVLFDESRVLVVEFVVKEKLLAEDGSEVLALLAELFDLGALFVGTRLASDRHGTNSRRKLVSRTLHLARLATRRGHGAVEMRKRLGGGVCVLAVVLGRVFSAREGSSSSSSSSRLGVGGDSFVGRCSRSGSSGGSAGTEKVKLFFALLLFQESHLLFKSLVVHGTLLFVFEPLSFDPRLDVGVRGVASVGVDVVGIYSAL